MFLFLDVIFSGLVELLSQKGHFKSLLSALLLCKSFKARLWEDSKYVSKQLDGIGKFIITSFEWKTKLQSSVLEILHMLHTQVLMCCPLKIRWHIWRIYVLSTERVSQCCYIFSGSLTNSFSIENWVPRDVALFIISHE